MADSGVDTSNESSDNPVFDHSHCVLEFSPPVIPIYPAGQPMPIDFSVEPHDHVGKMKCSTRARRYRLSNKIKYGIEGRNVKLRIAASCNNTEIVEWQLAGGADPNSHDEYGRSPLHLAASRGYIDVVRLLLRYGANPNIKDTLGNTPLHLAVCTNHIPVVIELLDAGTDVSSNDNNGRNPIQLAQSKLKLIRMRPCGDGHLGGTKWLIGEICMVVNMMLKYLKVQKADAGELESVCQRLEKVSTREEIDNEVQNLLDSLDCLKLK